MDTIKLISQLFDYYNRDASDTQLRIYLDALPAELPDQILTALVKEFTFMPKVKEILDTSALLTKDDDAYQYELRRTRYINEHKAIEALPYKLRGHRSIYERLNILSAYLARRAYRPANDGYYKRLAAERLEQALAADPDFREAYTILRERGQQ